MNSNMVRSEWQAEFEKTLIEDRPSSASSAGEIGFNEDLLCPHGKLSKKNRYD